MKKMWTALLGMIALATMMNAEQGGLIAGKDIFPPEEEGVIEADDQEGMQSDDSYGDDSSDDQADKEYRPEAQSNKKKNNNY